MKKILMAAAALMIVGAAPAHADNVAGLWMAESGKAVVEIKPCDNSLCGDIYWLRDDARQYDYQNPDPALRNQALCGLRILWGFKKSAAGWESGNIYKADDGDIYNAEIRLNRDDTLNLRGYVGMPMFGKSQTWNRVASNDYKRCGAPDVAYDPALEPQPRRDRRRGRMND